MIGTLSVKENASFASTLEARNASIYYFNVSGNTDMMGRLTVKENVSFATTLDVRNVSIMEDLNVSRNTFLKGFMNVALNASFATTLKAHNVSIVEDLIVSRNTTLVGTLNVNNIATFDEDVILKKQLEVLNVSVTSNLDITGNTTMTGTLDLKNNANISTLYVTGHSKHNTFECNSVATINGSLNVSGKTTMKELVATNVSLNNLLVYQNASFQNKIYVETDAYVKGRLEVFGTITATGKGTFTTLEYDNLQSKNTSSLNQVVNVLTVQDFYPKPDSVINTSSAGSLIIKVPATIEKEPNNINRVNGFTFKDNSEIVMESGTTMKMKSGSFMKLESGTDATFELGSIVAFKNLNTEFESITLNGRIITTSDRKLKTNIQPLTDTLEHIKNIHGHRYQRIDQDTERVQIGLIAQEVEETYPELVSDEGGTKRVDYISFIAVLLGSIQELESRVVLLETENQRKNKSA
jgi:hypothetical protein